MKKAMARDIKINYKQLTLGKLRYMCKTLLALDDNQRVVEIPERVLKGDGGGQGANDESAVAAMEEEEEGEQPVLAEISRKEDPIKKIGKKKKKLIKKQGDREEIADW